MLFATSDLLSSGMLRSADLVLTYRRFGTNYRPSLQGSSRIAWIMRVWSGQCGMRLFTFRGNGETADLLLHGLENHAIVLIFYFLLSYAIHPLFHFLRSPFLHFLHSPSFFLSFFLPVSRRVHFSFCVYFTSSSSPWSPAWWVAATFWQLSSIILPLTLRLVTTQFCTVSSHMIQ